MNPLRQLKWTAKSLRINSYCIAASRRRDVRIIEHPAPARTIQTPELKSEVLAFGAKHLAQREYHVPPISSIIARNFLVSADDGIVMNESRRVIKEMLSCPHSIDPVRRSVANPVVERLEGVYGILRSESASYYHSLIDNIPRAYLMHHQECRDLGPMEIFHAGRLNSIEAYLLPKLLPDNVTPRQFEKDRLYQPETLFMPGFLSGRFAGHLPQAFTEFLWDRVCPNRPPKKEHRILISRAKGRDPSKDRDVLNEEELTAALKPLGFERRVLEEHSHDEQVELFYDSDFVIGPHGAGLANIVFSRATRVVELFASNEVVPHFYFLSKALDHPYAYWKGDAENRNSSFRVNVPEVVELVKRSLGGE